jgi:hypothetical protein
MRSILFFVGRLWCEVMTRMCVLCALLDSCVCAGLHLHLLVWDILGSGIERREPAFARCDDIMMCSVSVLLTGQSCLPVRSRMRAFENRGLSGFLSAKYAGEPSENVAIGASAVLYAGHKITGG